MPTAKLTGLVSRLGGGPDAIESAADAELLGAFAADRDEAAFAELVRRHGRLVYGVCRRVTGNHHLAEDAFQAVFVVLAAKAAAIRPPSAVAAWLHGVAWRTALRARTMADRRRRRETTVEVLPEASSPGPREAPDAVALLDEEIARLPDHYRLPVVLCELEGVGRADAARRLGIAEGTLSSRLAAARKALADRLRSRGVALSAAGLSAVFAEAAGAGPPPTLVAKAVAAATPASVPAPVAVLSQGVIRMMFLQKLKVVAPLAVLAVALATVAALAAVPLATPPAPKPALVPVAAPVPKLAPMQSRLIISRMGELVTIDPDGKDEKVALRDDEGGVEAIKIILSPDGTRVAVIQPTKEEGNPPIHLVVYEVGKKGPGIDLGPARTAFWSADGKQIAVGLITDTDKIEDIRAKHELVTVATKERTPLKIPADHIVLDWSRDGRYFLTAKFRGNAENLSADLLLMNRDGTEHKRLGSGIFPEARLSPDGSRVAWIHVKPKEETPAEKKAREEAGGLPPHPDYELKMIDVASGKVATVEGVPPRGELREFCWSPDGKRIAYNWREIPKEFPAKETVSHIVTCDPDGRNPKTIFTAKSDGTASHPIDAMDWQVAAAGKP